MDDATKAAMEGASSGACKEKKSGRGSRRRCITNEKQWKTSKHNKQSNLSKVPTFPTPVNAIWDVPEMRTLKNCAYTQKDERYR